MRLRETATETSSAFFFFSSSPPPPPPAPPCQLPSIISSRFCVPTRIRFDIERDSKIRLASRTRGELKREEAKTEERSKKNSKTVFHFSRTPRRTSFSSAFQSWAFLGSEMSAHLRVRRLTRQRCATASKSGTSTRYAGERARRDEVGMRMPAAALASKPKKTPRVFSSL